MCIRDSVPLCQTGHRERAKKGLKVKKIAGLPSSQVVWTVWMISAEEAG